MSDATELPEDIKKHLIILKEKLGEEVGTSIEKTLLSMLNNLTAVSTANPEQASALFLSRPSGYVD